jgi:hypothetical protein
MSAEAGYKPYIVVFLGEVRQAGQLDEVRDGLSQRFELDEDAQTRLFSGEPVVFRRDLRLEDAEALKAEIESLGGVVWIDDLEVAGDDDHYQDRRKRDQDRRDAEAEAAANDTQQIDRRAMPGRRYEDNH